MMRLSYTEIVKSFNEEYEDYKSQNMSKCESLARTIDEFVYERSLGKMQAAAVDIAYATLFVTQEKVILVAKDKLLKRLKEIDKNDINKDLTNAELEDFEYKLKYILNTIDTIEEITYNQACWYYNEFNEVVRDFILSKFYEHPSIDDLIKVTLSRFKRDCVNTNSEKTIVYVSLMEQINKNCDIYYGINDLASVIQFFENFNVEDISKEQLNRNELQLLTQRINQLKEELSSR